MSTGTRWVVGACAVLSFAACRGKGGAGDEPGAPAQVVVSLVDLVGDYKANEVRADTKYKGKRVQVTGIVGELKKGVFDQIYIELGQGKQIDFDIAQCHFPKEDTDKVAALDKGAKITVDCKCEGKIVTMVNLADCKFVNAPATVTSGTVATKEAPHSGPSTADVCTKLEAAGVAKNCAKSETGTKFEIVGMLKGAGAVVRAADDAAFAKYVAGVEALPPTSALRPFHTSPKTHVVVHLTKGIAPATDAKAKAVVDAL